VALRDVLPELHRLPAAVGPIIVLGRDGRQLAWPIRATRRNPGQVQHPRAARLAGSLAIDAGALLYAAYCGPAAGRGGAADHPFLAHSQRRRPVRALWQTGVVARCRSPVTGPLRRTIDR